MMIGEPHRAFVRAVVAAAKANGFTRVSLHFGSTFADEISARWEVGQDNDKIRLMAEEIEIIDPET
jgi:hypothetical protein